MKKDVAERSEGDSNSRGFPWSWAHDFFDGLIRTEMTYNNKIIITNKKLIIYKICDVSVAHLFPLNWRKIIEFS